MRTLRKMVDELERKVREQERQERKLRIGGYNRWGRVEPIRCHRCSGGGHIARNCRVDMNKKSEPYEEYKILKTQNKRFKGMWSK
ncbi:MAG: hypothetical protein ACRDDF_05850 [Aeromonas sp.]